MFPDADARAAVPASVRWPKGFDCPRRGHHHGWALRAKGEPLEYALPPQDLGDARDDPVSRQARAHDLVPGGLSDGDSLERHFGAAVTETTDGAPRSRSAEVTRGRSVQVPTPNFGV